MHHHPHHSVLALCLMLGLGCAAAPHASEPRQRQILTLVVANSADSDVVPQAEVLLVGRSGVTRLGTTNEAGVLLIDKRTISSRAALVLLVCHPSFFCGAFQVDSDDLLDYDERYIQLAPATLL